MNDLPFDREKLIRRYPPLDFIAVYGSAISKQKGHPEESPMIDLIFGVESPLQWHRENLARNPRDYSLPAKFGGPEFVNWLQRIGAGIYYHPFIPFGDRQIKYGTISQKEIIEDLTRWTRLYLAGRLQKPTQILKTTMEIEEAQEKNLRQALDASLLLLPKEFSEKELYKTITDLSYLGDVRGKIKDSEKTSNIVEGNFSGFQRLYRGLIQQDPYLISNNHQIEQDKSNPVQIERYRRLPLPNNSSNKTNSSITADLQSALTRIIFSSSSSQTLKGLISSGLIRSSKYLSKKLKKKFTKT